MLSFDGLVAVCVLYVMGLFGVAFLAEKRAMEGKARWLNSPITYTLSLSIYTTAWTFYGAVGSAARSGLEFLTIYLGRRWSSSAGTGCCGRWCASARRSGSPPSPT
jgi:Na+/proline symporter